MNIGIFTDTYFPQISGVATSVITLQRELTSKGHNVYIFTPKYPDSGAPNPNIFRLPSMPFIFLPSQRVVFFYSPKLLFKLKKFKLDIVHTQTEFSVGVFGKIVAEAYKVPMIHTYHTMYVDYTHYIANGHLISKKSAQRFSRFFCNRAKEVIAPVEKTKNSLLEYGVKRPIHVIPTGIDFKPYNRENFSKEVISSTKNELGITELDDVILFIGRVATEKSIDLIINQMPAILEKNKHAKLVIIGDGPARDSLEKLVESLNIQNHVIFAGFRPWEDIGKYYQVGDVFVTASTSETQGLTYIEAMASGLVVIARKDDSISGVIENGVTGYYFEQPEELPEILCDILSDKNKQEEIIQNAFEIIRPLSSDYFGDSVEELYLSAIKNFKTSTASKGSFFSPISIRKLRNKK